MADDCSNLTKLKEPPLQTPENVAEIKQSPQPKFGTKMRFIITKNKNNSWVDDLHAQEQLNQIERVYH